MRAVGRGLLRVLLPLHAMRQTAHLAKQEAQRTRENVVVLRKLASQAQRAVTGIKEQPAKGQTLPAEPEDVSFAQAMAQRGPDAMSIPELRRSFVARKRMALAMAAVFALAALMQIAWGLVKPSVGALFFGLLCLASSQPLCFVLALSAHFRIWQLDNRRLSRAEKGGLADFRREVPRWWLAVLDPEFGRGRKDRS
ncbi:hypothetical protein [Azohydromonas australica]|uniref:hypothetical protein n=1 Tax=Azohydromonas australica TaxID=364039 RepID=UPI0012EB567A|nr:hypothetical protein [Azohydromonas australica]